MARPMPRPPPVTSAWEVRDSFDIRWPPETELPTLILNFKLLQGSARPRPRA
jgi:hypothetical protein